MSKLKMNLTECARGFEEPCSERTEIRAVTLFRWALPSLERMNTYMG